MKNMQPKNTQPLSQAIFAILLLAIKAVFAVLLLIGVWQEAGISTAGALALVFFNLEVIIHRIGL